MELGPEPGLAQVCPSVPSELPRPSVYLAKRVESSCEDHSFLVGTHQGPCLKPHAVSSQESGAEGQDVFMFSCRLRVELVAAGSCPPCVSIGGDKKSAPGNSWPPNTDSGPKASERPKVGEFSYRLCPHMLRILELLLLVVVPFGQNVEQQQVTENRGLRARKGQIEHGNLGQGQSPPHPTSDLSGCEGLAQSCSV